MLMWLKVMITLAEIINDESDRADVSGQNVRDHYDVDYYVDGDRAADYDRDAVDDDDANDAGDEHSNGDNDNGMNRH